MKLVEVHAKTKDGIELFRINPKSLTFQQIVKVSDDTGITDAGGNFMSHDKVILMFNNGISLIIEETQEKLDELINGD